MSGSAVPPTRKVTAAEAGRTCPYCQFPLKSGAAASACPACGSVHHTECWTDNAGCAVLGCEQGPTAARATPPAGRRTAASEPLTTPVAPTVVRSEQETPSRVSRSRVGGGLTIAVAALALAVAGVAVVLLLGQHSGGKPTKTATKTPTKTVTTPTTKTVTTPPTTTQSALPRSTLAYTGDDYTLRRPTGWTQVSSEVNEGSYISRAGCCLPSRRT
jgi:hypothetical protein